MYRFKRNSQVHTRWTLGIITLALCLTLMVSVSGVALAAGTATGRVFRDYNANGVQDAQEPGMGNVTITAYGSAGTAIGNATSAVNTGDYSITWTGTDTRVRLEFTGLPLGGQQGAFSAAGSGTSVQFVDAGAANVNYGFNNPGDYCFATPNLRLITTCFPDNTVTPVPNVNAVISHAYNGAVGSEVTEATAAQVGSTWGVAYKPTPIGSAAAPIIYVSAFAKRQSLYGPAPLNPSGQIYAIQGGLVSNFANIPNTGTSVHTAPYAMDSTFYVAPGKEGLGDLDLSEDGTTLYTINLNNRQLYSVDTTSGAVQAHGIIGPAACANGTYRPFGLGHHDGLVYVGGVCTAEGVAGTTADLHAYVYTFNPNGGGTALAFDFALNYPRGCSDIDATYINTVNPLGNIPCRTTAVGSQADWQPWRDAWPNPQQFSGFSPNAGGDQFFTYPQPILAGIEFVNEDMVISFRDRMGDQIGFRDNGPNNTFPQQLVTVTAGDMLRASSNGNGTWTMESNGTVGTLTSGNGVGNEQGPGNGEFYAGDNFVQGLFGHDDTITGGIVQVAGDNSIAAVVMDPLDFFSAGTGWFNNTTGNRPANRNFVIINRPSPFGKGNGLGDLAATCNAAPIEIGNYVWFDADHDGVQDPNELPLANIDVEIVDPANPGVVIATVTTDAQGRYIFGSDPLKPRGNLVAPYPNYAYSLPLKENTTYNVRIDTTQPNLVGYTTTVPNTGGAVRDSNGIFNNVTNFSVATVTTGTAGQNDHTIDFGFFAPPYSLGNRVWFDDGRGGGAADNGIQDGTEIGIDGVTVNLLDSLGNFIKSTTTISGANGAGFYLFDNLPPGSYIVEIPASNFAPGGPLNGLASSTPPFATPNDDHDKDDNGVNAVAGGVQSNAITLGTPPGEPTNELPADIGPQGSGVATNGNSNLTMDFGFFGTPTTYSLGNRVWYDVNNNGLIDTGEIGIGNVVLNLYTVTGGVTSPTPLRTTTTTAAGYYLFDNLPAGDYVVEVAPANCTAGGPLNGLNNSTGAGQEADPNLDGDNNDNGLDASGTCSVRSDIVTLGPGPSEPPGETDLGPQGSGIAPDNQSNLTVDFGYWGTLSGIVTPPPPARLDPAIVKAVDPAFAQPGEDVNWTITISNPHTVAINNVSFEDNFPSQLEIIRATADSTVGTVVISGNKVSYSIVVLNPGESVHVRVLTRIRPGTPVPFIITNTVNLTGPYVGSASATVLSAGALPATGFDPSWRVPLLLGLGVLAVLFGVGVVRLRYRRYDSA